MKGSEFVEREYRPEDINSIEAGELDQEALEVARAVQPELLMPAITVISKGKIIMCMGLIINPFYPHVADFWIVRSKEGFRQEMEMRKIVANYIPVFLRQTKVTRIQTFIPDNAKRCQAFARAVGGIEEGRLRKFGKNGEDYVIFGRTK